jgi:5-methylcytosine-specific restriction endonuclease McrA
MRQPIFGSISLFTLREQIASSADTEEDAHVLIQKMMQELDQTNWSQLITKKKAEEARRQEKILNRQVSCKRCKQKFKYRDMQMVHVVWEAGHYCATCFDHFNKEHTYTCPFCNIVYLSRNFSRSCPACRIKDEEKESLVLQRQLREAKKARRSATLKLNEWLATLQHFGGYCAYCQKQPYQVLEHFIPINPGKQNGGGTTVDNCVPACESCNKKKNKFFPDAMLCQSEFASITGFSEYGYGIDIKAIERVWRYLDNKRQPTIGGWNFEERKQFHNTIATKWWIEKKTEDRQKIMNILNADM